MLCHTEYDNNHNHNRCHNDLWWGGFIGASSWYLFLTKFILNGICSMMSFFKNSLSIVMRDTGKKFVLMYISHFLSNKVNLDKFIQTPEPDWKLVLMQGARGHEMYSIEWSYNSQNFWGTNYRVYKLTLVGFVAAAAL